MQYEIITDFSNDDALRSSFNALAKKTFGLSFEDWYKNGFWGEKYRPYSVLCDGKIAANISVNLIDCTIDGEKKHYVQLGTVMTDKDYRGKGFSRLLMQTVLKAHENCDGIFLYANDSVLDFYPKFGFVPMREYRFFADISSNAPCTALPVPMQSPADFSRFLSNMHCRKSLGKIELDTDGLIMFYLTQFMRECVYFIDALDCYAIAKLENGVLTLYDVFCSHPVSLFDVINAFGACVNRAELAFVPKSATGFIKYELNEEDTTFFVRGEALSRSMQTLLSFPELSRA